MSLLRSTIVALVSLIVLVMIFIQTTRMKAPPLFTVVVILIGVGIFTRLVLTLIRGY